MDNEIISILTEINNTLKNSSPAWMPALFALVGAIGGASVVGYWQYKSSKLNANELKRSKELEIKSNVISKQRQQWMNEIRNTCKVFLSEYDLIIIHIGSHDLSDEEHRILYKSASENATFLKLMLNPEKEHQKKASDAIDSGAARKKLDEIKEVSNKL